MFHFDAKVICRRSCLATWLFEALHIFLTIAGGTKVGGGALDTGHFFHRSPAQGLAFQNIPKGQESKSWVFFEGLRSRKEKIIKTPSLFGQKIKWGEILYEKN